MNLISEFSLHENNEGEKILLNGIDNLDFSFSKGNSEEKLLTPVKRKKIVF